MLARVCDGVSVVLRPTILQLATPDAMRGRVSSINGLFIGSSNELGAFYEGSMARLLGLVPAVGSGGRRVGKGCVSSGRSRWAPVTGKTTTYTTQDRRHIT